jgi:hypothetical protein
MGSGFLIRNQAKLPASSILFVKGRSDPSNLWGRQEIKGKGREGRGRGGRSGPRASGAERFRWHTHTS